VNKFGLAGGTLRDAMRLSSTFALLLAGLCACSSPPEYPIPRADPPGVAPPKAAEPPLPPAGEGVLPCVGEGDVIAGPGSCCEGLSRVDFYKGSMIRLDGCELENKGRATCVRCGNGRCGAGENACNCPADCPF
jgi:uncharacterized membrane protein